MRIKELKGKLAELLEFREELAGKEVAKLEGISIRQFPGGRGLGTFAGLCMINSILTIFCERTGKNLEESITPQDFPVLTQAARDFFSHAKKTTQIPAVREEMELEEEMVIRAIEQLSV